MCTSIAINADNGQVFWGRTMDMNLGMFGEDPGIDVDIINIPCGATIASQLQPWTSKYSMMGLCAADNFNVFDGINAAGLAGGLQVLMESTHAEAEQLQARQLQPLLGEEFVTFVLTNFSSVAEIKAHIQEYGLLHHPYRRGQQRLQLPGHYMFVDETNDSVIIEPTDQGGFKLYDSIGVMTNSPEYDWHLTNLRNYLKLTNVDPVKSKKIYNDHLTLKPIETGTGYGMFGLPGDYTSPSRFVRAALLAHNLDSFTAADGINQLYSVLKTAMIPRGLEHGHAQSPVSDYTRYWVGYDLTQRQLYVQTCQGLAFNTMKLVVNQTEITRTTLEISNDAISLN
ncbi:MAG: linear amide C-N hydrolase [Lactobacillus sp.]|uniref:linear amide C-N hydrolase n=1 Tax=Bombilactobacillus bombi TaxID=1303590 RepID=UPI0035E9D4B2|nr:linear amide C-N hydrolase [Lactobacillus sp.]